MSLTYHFKFRQLINSTTLGYTETEYQDGTFITIEVMGCQLQVGAIEKAIRHLFTDPVTYLCDNYNSS